MILLIRIFIFPECQLMVELLVVEFLDIHKQPPSPAIRAPQVKSKERGCTLYSSLEPVLS